VAENHFRVRWSDGALDAALHKDAVKLASEKYSQVCYNQKR